ncbi:MAG: M20/M25/M40 family metallo-hydrolase, partial [Thermoplasmata archaeon]|nr:M20/M25/M40 family metallo-hydrolase [Thermoplasmata archaeon]
AQAEGWSTDPFSPNIEGDRIYGLGASDMKAGLAIIMSLYNEFRDKLNLIFTAVGDEETDSLGSFALLDEKKGPVTPFRSRIVGALVAEPTNEKVMLGARGRYALRLIVHGRAAHGARPYLGINAVEKAAEVLTALKKLPIDSHPRLGKGSCCVLRINGGAETLSVPDRCEITIDRHITRLMSKEEVMKEFRCILSDIDVPVDVGLVEREVPYLMPYTRAANEPFIRHFLSTLGNKKEIIYGESVGDFNIFGGLMPTIVYGPKGKNHHSPDEFVLRSSIERVHTGLKSWLEKVFME